MATARATAQLDATWRGGTATRAAERDVKGVTTEAQKTATGFGGLSKAAGAAVAGFAAVAGGAALLGRGLVAVTQLAGEQQRVETQLAATLESTGNAAGLSAAQLKDLASSLQATTTFGDEAIIASESLLLTFTKIGSDVFPRAQAAILDMSTALGTDLKGQTLQLGKALNDPIAGIGALAEAGIQFTSSQKDTIKTLVEMGDVAAAQSIILDELETQFGGSAAAAADTFNGRVTQLQNVLGDLGEAVGNQLLPPLTDLAEEVTPKLIELMTDLGPELDAVGSAAAVAADEVADLIGAIDADKIRKFSNALNTIWKFTAPGMGKALKDALPSAQDLRESLAQYSPIIADMVESQNALERSQRTIAAGSRAGARDFEEVADSVEAATEEIERLSRAQLKELGLLGRTTEATERMVEAHDQLGPAVGSTTLALDNESEAVRNLFAGYEKLSSQVSGVFLEAMDMTDGKLTSLQTATQDLDSFILDLAVTSGATATEMAFLATATGDYTQAQIDAAVKAVEFETRLGVLKQRFADGEISVYQFRDAVQDLFAAINGLQDKTVTVTVNTVENGRVVTNNAGGTAGISEFDNPGGSSSAGQIPPPPPPTSSGGNVPSPGEGDVPSRNVQVVVQGREAASLVLHDLQARSRPGSILEV